VRRASIGRLRRLRLLRRRSAKPPPFAAALAAAALTFVLTAPSAGAGTAPPVAARILLTGQGAWTPLGGDATLRVRVEGAGGVTGLTVSVVARQAVTSRAEFDRTTRDEGLGSVLDQVVVPLDSLPVDASGDRLVTLGLEAPGSARDAARLGIRRNGVFPLEVELHDDQDRTLSHFVTYLVAVDSTAPLEQPLGVAWVWPLVAGPAVLPDGSLDPAVVASFGPSGRLGRQAAALQRDTDVPITVIPGPETMQAWAAAGRDDQVVADGASAVRAAIAVHQVVAGPYVPVDLPSLLAAGMNGAVDTQLVQGDEALRRFFATRLDPRTRLVRPVDGAALARLQVSGVDRVILESSSVAAPSGRLTPAQPFTVQASGLVGGGPVSAVSGDAGLAALLAGDAPPALRAQRLLAGLALVAVEQPAETRAVVVVNPDSFAPSEALLDAVLAGLRNHPWLKPMRVDDVFAQIPLETSANDTAATRALAQYNPPKPPVAAASYDAAVGRLNAFRALVTPGDARVALAERAVVSSVSSAWSTPDAAPRALAELSVVDATVNAFISQIQVPDPSTITLTSRSGEIPLTFQNETGQTVSVLVQLDSQKLAFPDGSSRLVDLPPRSTTVRFAVEARTSGSFPLRLSVRSADGALAITNTKFRVQSTAVSTVGLVLMVGAGIFLALWWGLDFRRRRRGAHVRIREPAVPTT